MRKDMTVHIQENSHVNWGGGKNYYKTMNYHGVKIA